MGIHHIPVLTEEVVALLQCAPHEHFVDATLGEGGHALEILKRTAPDGILIGIEWDEDALAIAQDVLRPFGDRVRIFRENFICLPEIIEGLQVKQVDGILLDLGLCSLQLERKERGFSLRGEGPLDMRMDQRLPYTAADLVNRLPKETLENILVEYGEERWARRIAGAILDERQHGPIETTHALRKIVWRAIPRRYHSRRIDPATRTFQALRIQINSELENLRQVLESGWKVLKAGGRICVISFHSLEDRIVKETFRHLATQGDTRGYERPAIRVVTRKVITPSPEERAKNSRSRSAKLRCAEKV